MQKHWNQGIRNWNKYRVIKRYKLLLRDYSLIDDKSNLSYEAEHEHKGIMLPNWFCKSCFCHEIPHCPVIYGCKNPTYKKLLPIAIILK